MKSARRVGISAAASASMLAGLIVGVGAHAPAAAAPSGPASQVAAAKWKPLPTVYSNVRDTDSKLVFPYAFILSVGQTRQLNDSGILPVVANAGIRMGDVSEIARVVRTTIAKERLTTESGCVLLMYSPTPLYNPSTKEMTHWAGHWYRGTEVCTP